MKNETYFQRLGAVPCSPAHSGENGDDIDEEEDEDDDADYQDRREDEEDDREEDDEEGEEEEEDRKEDNGLRGTLNGSLWFSSVLQFQFLVDEQLQFKKLFLQ